MARLIAIFTSLFITTSFVIAAPEGGEKGELLSPIKQGLPAMIAAFIVFGIVFFVLKSKAWPAIAGGLDDRANKIREEIEKAEIASQQAKAALDQYEQNLADARAESQRRLDEALQQAKVLADERMAKNDAEMASIREKAMKDIESAKRAAINEIYADAANTATAIASKILQREVSAEDQRRLVEESLAQLGGIGENGIARS